MPKTKMHGPHWLAVGGFLAALGVIATPSLAQSDAPASRLQEEIDQLRRDVDALRRQYEQRIADLEAQIAALQPSQPAQVAAPVPVPPPGAEGTAGPPGTLPVYGAPAAGSKIFIPDIAVIGDFIGTAGDNSVAPSPAFEMHESEASFQAVVDPYARGDFFLAFGSSGVEVEEAYVTLPALPGGLLARAGKLRSAFGKVNTFHNHVLPWVDRPLMTTNLLGGEEGMSDSGVSVARLIPNPWLFLEVTGQVFRGNSEDVFSAFKPGDVSYTAHMRAYQDLSESTNLDLGTSYARGHNDGGVVGDVDIGRFTTSLYGVDASVRWKPLRRSRYRSFVGRTEVVWSRRDQLDAPQHAFGYYVSADYQLARRWFAGGRYDRSARAASADVIDRGRSAVITFWPSEFSQVRAQYRRTAYGLGSTAHELLFQVQFSIGIHGAHPF